MAIASSLDRCPKMYLYIEMHSFIFVEVDINQKPKLSAELSPKHGSVSQFTRCNNNHQCNITRESRND